MERHFRNFFSREGRGGRASYELIPRRKGEEANPGAVINLD